MSEAIRLSAHESSFAIASSAQPAPRPRASTRGRLGQVLGAWFVVLAWSLSVSFVQAQTAGTGKQQEGVQLPSPALPTPPPTTAPPSELKQVESSLAALTNTPIRVVGQGVFELGHVRMDKRKRTVAFPATLNVASTNQTLMEYFLVTEYGKTHESILKTEAQPYHVHLAMLLLSSKGVSADQLRGEPQTQIKEPSKQTLPGNQVAIEIRWRGDNGLEERRSAEELLIRQDKKPVKAAWVYNGSAVWSERFMAQLEGSMISLITDPVALVNSVAPGHDNDQIWLARTDRLPPPNVPLQVTISLSP